MNRVVRFALGLCPILAIGLAFGGVPVEQWEVTERRAYDRRNFTQGLEIHDGVLWVSAGQYGESAVRRYQLDTMKLIDEVDLPSSIFAEGLTRLDERVLVLTWRARKLLVLNAEDLTLIGASDFPSEGWGLTQSAGRVWFSNGSDRLYSFALDGSDTALKSIAVTRDGRPVKRLNELEWINGEIWANVWQTDQIMRINPTSGEVNAVIDLTALYPRALRAPGSDVLNGIAYDSETDKIWVTGKRWPWLYAIRPPRPSTDESR